MKSLFTKFMLIFLSVLVLTFGVLIVSLNKMLEDHFIDLKFDQLLSHADSIQESYGLEELFRGVNTLEIQKEIDNLERYFDATLWIVGQRGYVYIASADDNLDLVKSELDVSEVALIFQGQTIKRKGFYNSVSKEPVITIGYPIKNVFGEVIYALYIHVPVPEVLEAHQGLYSVAITTFFIILFLAMGILFFFTRRLIRDIKALNKTVENISGGQYTIRHETKRKDEIGQLSDRTNHMAEALEQAETFRKHFISDLSHDFRSPLTSIIGYTEGMLDGTIERDQNRYLRVIRDESKRLLKLSDTILSLTDVMDHKVELEALNLEALILGILDSKEMVIRQKNLNVTIDFPDAHGDALGDGVLIPRVLQNLVDNAIKFSPQGGDLMISVSTEEGITVSIGNDIKGPVDLKRIWDRFSKGDDSRGEERESFGLGLSIVKEVLLQHHTEAITRIHENQIFFQFTLKKA